MNDAPLPAGPLSEVLNFLKKKTSYTGSVFNFLNLGSTGIRTHFKNPMEVIL